MSARFTRVYSGTSFIIAVGNLINSVPFLIEVVIGNKRKIFNGQNIPSSGGHY